MLFSKKKERNMPKPDESVCQTEKIGGRREKRVRDRQITSLIDGDDSLKSEEDRFASAEKVILRWDPSLEVSRRSLNWEDSGDEAD